MPRGPDACAQQVSTTAELEPLPPHLSPSQTRWFSGLAQREQGVMLILDFTNVLATDDELVADY